MVGEALLLPDKVLYGVKPGSGKGFQSFISVIVHVDLRSDPSESKTVGNYKGIHPIILWQVWISLLEFADLLWVEHMDLSLVAAKRSVLPQRVDQVVSVDGCGLHPDDHIGELQRFHCRYDFSCQQFSTAKIVLHGKAAIFDSIRIHQARNVVLAAHINANEKPVDI